MKKVILGLLVLLTCSAYSQSSAAAIKLGFYSPDAAETGFIIGYEGGRHIDEMLDVCWSFDWYSKDFEDKGKKKKAESIPGLSGTDIEKLSDTTINTFPLMVSLTVKFPVAPKAKVYLNGGFGAELLYASYSNYSEDDEIEDESEFAFDWNWRLGLGGLYQLGERSEFFGEFGYHYSMPSYEYEIFDVKYEREYDMRGVMGRVGIRYYY